MASFGVSHSRRTRLLYIQVAPGPMCRELWPPGEDATGYTFFHHHRAILHALCPISNGLFQPGMFEFSLALSRSESSHIGGRYPDLRGPIQFPENSSGKSPESCFESTSDTPVLRPYCNITTVTIVKAKDLWMYFKGETGLVAEFLTLAGYVSRSRRR